MPGRFPSGRDEMERRALIRPETPAGGLAQPAATTAITITVALSEKTVEALVDGNFKLSAFHAVSCDEGGGAALVWGHTAAFASPFLTLAWTENYSAYGSTLTPQSAPSSVIVGTDTVPAEIGDAFDVGRHALLTPDPNGGYPGVIALRNTTSTPYTGGISLPAPVGAPNVEPICAFPLFGNNSVYVGLSDRVLLMMATPPFAIGTPVDRQYGPTVAVDISATAVANLDYDINAGWSGDPGYTSVVAPGQFSSLLITGTGTGSWQSTASPVSALGRPRRR